MRRKTQPDARTVSEETIPRATSTTWRPKPLRGPGMAPLMVYDSAPVTVETSARRLLQRRWAYASSV